MSATDSTKFVCMFDQMYDFHSKMLKFYKEQKYCDVFLEAIYDGKKISAHRCILASASNYFKTIFANLPRTSTTLTVDGADIVHNIEIEDVTGDILSSLVEYCYTCEINIGEHNEDKILAAATRFQFHDMRRMCYSYFLKIMTPENCLSIRNLADQHNLNDLQLYAVGFFCSRFVEVINTTEFLSLEFDQLRDLLEYNEINTQTEEEILWAIVKWVKHNYIERKSRFRNLYSFVNFANISKSLMSKEVANQFSQFNSWNSFTKISASLLLMDYKCARKMKMKKNDKRSMIAIGKSDTEDITSIWRLQIEKENEYTWRLIHKIPKKSSYYHVFFLKKQIIFAEEDQLDIIDLETGKSTKSPSFNKQFYSGAVFAESIYLIGGVDDATVLRYDLRKEFKTLAPMTVPRKSACCAVLSGLIYVAGGTNGVKALNSAECYNPFLNKWTPIASMKTGVLPVDATAVDGFIYFISSQAQYDVKVHQYDVKNNLWSQTYALSNTACPLGISHYTHGLVYALGNDHIESFYTVDSKTTRSLKIHVVPPEILLIKVDIEYFPVISSLDGSDILWR